MDSGLRYLQYHEFFKINKIKKVSKKRLKNHLLNDGAFIAAYKEQNSPHEWHYSLFIQQQDTWVAINYSNGKELITKYAIDVNSIYSQLDKSAIWLITK